MLVAHCIILLARVCYNSTAVISHLYGHLFPSFKTFAWTHDYKNSES